jgi:hypothetical protein
MELGLTLPEDSPNANGKYGDDDDDDDDEEEEEVDELAALDGRATAAAVLGAVGGLGGSGGGRCLTMTVHPDCQFKPAIVSDSSQAWE